MMHAVAWSLWIKASVTEVFSKKMSGIKVQWHGKLTDIPQPYLRNEQFHFDMYSVSNIDAGT